MMIKSFISGLENSKLSFWRIVFLIYAAAFIRTFLENYANSLNQYRVSGVIDTFFHYPLWFIMVFLSAFIIARILTKEKIEKIARLGAIFAFIIILPPIIDIIVNLGGQIPYIFITGSYFELAKSFISFLGGGMVGFGIKIEAALAVLGFGFYIFHKTGKISRSVGGAVLLYAIIFAALALPALIFSAHNWVSGEDQAMAQDAITNFYYLQEPFKAATNFRTFIVEQNNFESQMVQNIKNQYALTLSIFFLLVNTALLAWCLLLYSVKKFIAVFKNFRYLRIIHYFIMALVGVYFGARVLGGLPFNSLFDVLSFIALFMALLCAWLFAVWENDEVDIEIDRTSNPDRPLAGNAALFSADEWGSLKYLFLFLSLSFAFLNGLYSFVFILLFILVYHLYSTPPLRLKRFPVISSFLIAVNALLAIFMGFFFSAGAEDLSVFPLKYALGILIIFSLAENVKNIKDIEGDKKEGIKTLPVILGERWGKFVTGLLLFLATLLAPVIFYPTPRALLLAIVFGLILFWLVNKKNFQEKYIFWAYFVFITILFALLVL